MKLRNPLSGSEAKQKLGNVWEVPRGTNIPGGEWLDPLGEVSEHFSDHPVKKKIHLVVQVPAPPAGEHQQLARVAHRASAIAAETNETEGPLPKRLKLEGDRSQEERRAGLQSPQFHSESLLPRGDQFHPQVAQQFTDFHRRYWGHPIDPALTTLPTYGDEEDPDSDVLPGNPFLDVLGVRFLVRAEYIRAFDAAKALYDKSRVNHLAVVTGQPGIGATPSAAICSA